MDHAARHTFDAPIERVWAMVTNPDAHITKFSNMGHRDIEVLECVCGDGTFRITVRRVVDLDVPGFARRIIQPTNTVVSTDEWHDNGDGSYGGNWTVEAVKPIEIAGSTSLAPDGD